MEDYESEAIINHEILKPLYGMIKNNTRKQSLVCWGLYDGTVRYCGFKPKIWYRDGRVSIFVDGGKIITRHNKDYLHVGLSNVRCYEKIMDWLSVHMPVILKPWGSNDTKNS